MNNIFMRRKIGENGEYKHYQDYIDHQKVKTTDPVRREKWLGKEWQWKINVFTDNFSRLSEIGLKPKSKCICLGARTGQEVVALNNLGYEALGIDIVPYEEANVVLGDIHDLKYQDNSFEFAFTNILDHSIFPEKFISETERVLKPGGLALFQLQLNIQSDEYAENDIYSGNDVINLFKNSKVIWNQQIPNNKYFMNWEILMKKN